MTKDQHKDSSTDSSKDSVYDQRMLDLSEVEKVFVSPNSPKPGIRHDVHLITNEKKHGKDALKHAEHTSVRHEQCDADHPSQPLLESPRERPKPPLAGPEIDDLDDSPATPQPGVDDGLLDPGETTLIHHAGHDEKEGKDGSAEEGGFGEDGKWKWPSTGFDEGDYPYDINGLGPRFGIDERPLSPVPGSIPDVNTYQQKKNLAQGMMDLALLSANANQLRYVLESATTHPYYYPSLALITLSIIFQIAVGVGLIMNSRYNVKDEKDICKADKINNMTVLGVFLITTVNVFITSFSVATSTSPTVPSAPAIQQVG